MTLLESFIKKSQRTHGPSQDLRPLDRHLICFREGSNWKVRCPLVSGIWLYISVTKASYHSGNFCYLFHFIISSYTTPSPSTPITKKFHRSLPKKLILLKVNYRHTTPLSVNFWVPFSQGVSLVGYVSRTPSLMHYTSSLSFQSHLSWILRLSRVTSHHILPSPGTRGGNPYYERKDRTVVIPFRV